MVLFDSPPEHEQHAGAAAEPEAVPSSWRFGAGALVGGTFGTTPQVVGAGSLFVELVHRSGLGVGLDGGLESSRATALAWASQRWLTLYARLGVPVNPRVTFVATLGVRGWLVEVGAPQLAARNLLAGGAALTVGVDVALGPVVLLLRALGAGRYPEERISIAGNSAIFLKWWQVGAQAGLGWHFP